MNPAAGAQFIGPTVDLGTAPVTPHLIGRGREKIPVVPLALGGGGSGLPTGCGGVMPIHADCVGGTGLQRQDENPVPLRIAKIQG